MSKKITFEYRDKTTNEYLGECIMNPQNIKFEPSAGLSIHNAAHAVIDISNTYKLPVRLIFNDRKIDVHYNKMNVQNIIDSYLAQTR